MAAESGANACPCKVVGKGEKASPGTTLEGGYASWITVDWFTRVKEPSAEPATAAEGVTHAGASAVAQGGGGAGTGWQYQASAFSMKNRLVQYLESAPPAYIIDGKK